ncbi:hypothetical protein N7495_002366 [Penicillium taxi]|uniref:uncharacterized protein n=1 Tax=Penicillium taxi TaxID=168475 RepID=UPI002545168D|nr:uncharacterized protein N7495_002366 [Penicillium taxi]KAJ5901838.1 hypothetical protein N7495_002366 [Penicillium taxi]
MSKKFKSQASSSRAAAGGFGSFGGFSGFNSSGRQPSSLNYISEPLDLSRISEQQLVIAFKNSLKKDETTRTKALEELKEYVLSVEVRKGTLDESFVEAWMKIYPRVSIDLSRRARQLAHIIQGSVSRLAGKRIVPHLSKVIGAWLAGIYDSDRQVHQAALESFTKVFSTEEKRNNVWKIYQSAILEFIDDVLLHQTALTLSDERTVKKDDAETKYTRVVGAALMLFNRILGNSPDDVLQKGVPEIEEILGSKSLWAFCDHDDPFVRRSVYVLLRTVVTREPGWLDWKVVSSAVIGKALSRPQLGSALELSESILLLTSSRPSIWIEDYSSKTSASKRLLQYIKKGSQGSGAFWSNLDKLLQIIPQEVLAGADKSSTDGKFAIGSAKSITEAFQEGLNLREELRQNFAIGWKHYIKVGAWLAVLLPEEQRSEFIQQRLSPLVTQYVRPNFEFTQWSLPPQSAADICAEYITFLISNEQGLEIQLLWTKLSEDLLEAVKLSSPEQSKDFRSSQDAICAESKRLFALETATLSRIQNAESEAQARSIFEKSNLFLLDNSLKVLHSRNGKPYGAAGIVEECILQMPSVAKRSKELAEFIQTDVSDLLYSPSADRLISIVLACREWDGFSSSFEGVVERALELDPEQYNSHILQSLLSALNFNELGDREKLNSLVDRALDKAFQGTQLHWSTITTILQNQTSRGELVKRIFVSIIDALSFADVVNVLHGLSHLGKTVPSAVREFQNGENGSSLTQKLLFLQESTSEEVAALAESVMKTFEESVAGDTSTKSKLEILQNGFSFATPESLSIESLVIIVKELIKGIETEEFSYGLEDIFPSFQAWDSAMAPFLQLPPLPSTAITSPLRGTVHLIQLELSESLKTLRLDISRDSARCSAAFRLATVSINALSTSEFVAKMNAESLETLFYFLPLAIQLIEDDLNIEEYNGISGALFAEEREEYSELLRQGQEVIRKWCQSNEPLRSSPETSISQFLFSLWESKLEGLAGISPNDYRIGQTFAQMINLGNNHNVKSSDELAKICREARTANPIRSAAWFASLRTSILANPVGNRILNELVADLTGLNPQHGSSTGLRKISLLNILLLGEEAVVTHIPTQRLVFLTKNLLECLNSDKSIGLRAEIMITLVNILPHLVEIYGSHWDYSMKILGSVFGETNDGEQALPLLMASILLFTRLMSMAEGDCNDDLRDAWLEEKNVIFSELASTIFLFDASTTFHKPRDETVSLLQCLISVMPMESIKDVNSYFRLLTVQSRSIQRAAYTILHRYLPRAQEQVSIDVALSKSTVSLPDELLSLLVEAPNISMVNNDWGDDKMWTSIRSYLLSWKIVFDHVSNVSLPVREFYVANIKENDVLIPLLEFTFDFLQSSQGKIIDASKIDIRSFEFDIHDKPENEFQWLLVHLYYLSLTHLSTLTRNWWIDTKKRVKGPVESWTEKFISPLVVYDSCQNIVEWIATQDPNEERALEVKISPRIAEIVASIPVDEDSPPVAMSISLPPSYPLQPAVVVGRSRVLVDEKKWRSWMLTFQGVILFSNGNIVDGLMAFRKNVQGALKGHTECAICYSIVSTDMQTPNKRCATCKNSFHGSCLYRWFKSSNQSTCPLCRNNFVYV